MTQVVNEGIVEKIRKIQAMTKSPNEHEAEVAMAMMQKLLLEHNIALEEVKDVEADPMAEYIHDTELQFSRSGGTDWKRELIYGLAAGNFCKALNYTTYSGAWSRQFILIGKPVNVQMVKEMFRWLEPQLIREATTQSADRSEYWIPAATWKDSFLRGAAKAIRSRLAAQVREVRDANANNTNALMVINNELNNALAHFYPKLGHGGASMSPNSFSHEAYGKGHAHGSTTNLGSERKLNPSGRKLLG